MAPRPWGMGYGRLMFALAFLGPATPAFAQTWQVPEAPIRFQLRLADRPTHRSAGYFVHLPDGGILPAPTPGTVVMTEGGDPVESCLLWHNAESGMAFVFADPGGAGDVNVYVMGQVTPKVWKPESGLTPSAILCVDPTRAGTSAAKELARLGRVGPTVHYRNKAGIRKAPLSVGGDDSGRPRPGSFYLLAHVVTSDPGKTWIAPFTLDGQTEVEVDGKKLVPTTRIDKWGGTGDWFDLAEGLHRVEIFQTAPGKEPYAAYKKSGGLMYLTWRTPHATMEELGGVRSNKVPMSGTSRMETRVLEDREIVRSGSCVLKAVQAQNDGPVACMTAEPSHTFWFEGEEPLLIYELNALTSDQPEDTAYTWTFPEGGKVEGKTARWLFSGLRDHRVTLTARSGKGTSECVHPFYGFSTESTSLEDPGARSAFRAACTGMIETYPLHPDPVATWSQAHWNNLIRTLELGEGYAMLRNLLTARWDSVRGKLAPEQLAVLEGVYLDTAERQDPKEAVESIQKFRGEAFESQYKNDLDIREAEVLMYYLDDKEAAAKRFEQLARAPGDIAERAKVRLGDLAFLRGDLNKATEFYADVQNRARRNRNAAVAPTDGLVTEQAVAPGGAGRPAPDRKTNSTELTLGPAAVDKWKTGALLDVSISENVATLIEDNYLLEAQRALRAWEREFPLSKISGDFILRESRLYMEIGDCKRARAMLEAYCREVDASSFLPDAARLLIQCAKELKEPPDALRGLLEKVKGRLKFHPVARDLDAYLSGK